MRNIIEVFKTFERGLLIPNIRNDEIYVWKKNLPFPQHRRTYVSTGMDHAGAQDRPLGTFVFISHPAQTDSSVFFSCLSSRLPVLPSSTPPTRKPVAFSRSILLGRQYLLQ